MDTDTGSGTDDFIGKSFGHYQIIEPLGQGGMATVFKALDTHLDRIVAVKIMMEQGQHSTQYVGRFRREARAMAQLTHPAIVNILDYGDQDGVLYLVMELMPGGTLKQKLGKPMPPEQAARILLPIARGLHYAHQHDIIHRDIKPTNILLTDSGEPMISDFGIAKIMQGEETTGLTTTGAVIGTPEYMAPEQGLGKEIDKRADIYSLGIVFYEMVTGVRPYTANTPLTVLLKHASEPLPPPRQFVPNIPADVERLLYKMLAKNPEDRYSNMEEVIACLEKIAQGKKLAPDKARPVAIKPPAARKINWRLWLPAALAAIGVIFILAALYLIFWMPRNPRTALVTGVTGDVRSQSAAGPSQAVRKGTPFPLADPVRITSGNGQARLDLTGGSTVCIAPHTDIEFVPDTKDTTALFHLKLRTGRLVVMSEDQEVSFKILEPYPLTIQGKGMIFGMEYTPTNGPQLDLNCLGGSCKLQSEAEALDLANGGHTRLAQDAPFQPADNPDNAYWNAVCAGVINLSVTNVPFPLTVTPTPAATLTLTPAPPTYTPTLTQTITASPTSTVTPTPTVTITKTRVIIYPSWTPKPQDKSNPGSKEATLANP